MSRHVVVPASGTLEHPTDAAVAARPLQVRPARARRDEIRLNGVDAELAGLHDAAPRKSGGLRRSDVDFLNLILNWPSAYRGDAVAHRTEGQFGLIPRDSRFTFGEQDNIISILEGDARAACARATSCSW